jgi:NADH-quinone oxidoreductase subunit E
MQKKSYSLIYALRNKLELKEAEYYTKDMLFAIETVSCLGACGFAPIFLVGENVYDGLDDSR